MTPEISPAFAAAAPADMDLVSARAVPATFAYLIRGDLVVWAGPVERLDEAPLDCRRMVVNPEDLAATAAALGREGQADA